MDSYKKIIVTGHLGFIASAFCHMYKNKYEITGVDFNGHGSMIENLVDGVKDIRADISDTDQMKSLFEEIKPDAIINFAAESHVDRANENDLGFWKSNVLGARNLALLACENNIRMVHVSTDEVYGDAEENNEPWTENSRISPKNAYAVTKTAAEMMLQAYCNSSKHNLDVVITRGANTIGPRQFPEKAVPKAIWCFNTEQPFPLFRTPAKRMWMYVDDHVTGIEAALRLGKKGETYNLAPGFDSEAITEVVIEKIRSIIGKGIINKVDDRDNYDLRYWMHAEKAKNDLKWEAQYDLQKTLSSTVNWYMDNMDWLKKANMHFK